jgi:malate dehydrogenase (oxaloacetate-decarboxylating)
MRKYSFDIVARVKMAHRPGQMARFAAAMADENALLGEISTVHVGERDTTRDITLECSDEAHTRRVLDAVRAVEGVELLEVFDRVFECHRGGKIAMKSRVRVEQVSDLRYVYTPGVARVSMAIAHEPERAWELTGLARSVGIFTNGSRVLGLGDIGPLASLPVMEGKAMLYDRFAELSATPILLDELGAERFVDTVVAVSRSFGGIHLEDIRIPECFAIEAELDRRLDKPVMHDDQHGTATVALSALLNACRATGLDPRTARLGQIGLGAAGSAIARLALSWGVREVMVADVSADAVARMCGMGALASDLEQVMRECDIVVATTGKPGLIQPGMVRKGQIIFALSNPEPEIEPPAAMAAGAAFAGDGRSINNALAYPGIFRGALEVRSRSITTEMLLAASEAIADCAQMGHLVPSPFHPTVHRKVSDAVIAAAQRAGLENTARL